MLEDNKNYYMAFPTRLRLILDETGISQQELADFVGVKRQTVAQWKDGKTVPDIYNFQKIAQYFKVPYEYLLGDTNCKVRENMHLEEVLGLSDGAINTLSRFCTETIDVNGEQIPLSQIISDLLQHQDFTAAIHHFEACLMESKIKTLREYDYKYSDKITKEIRAAMQFLKNVGITVKDFGDMKYYYLQQAKDSMGKALYGVEQKFLAKRLEKIIQYMEGINSHDDFDDLVHEFLVKEFGYGDSDQAW